MLRWVRRRLALIRYYSARRERSTWSRASDLALIASFAMALPATWICDRTASRIETVARVSGTLQQTADGEWFAFATHPEYGTSDSHVPQDEFWGFWAATVERRVDGFPFATSIAHASPRIDLTPAPARNRDPLPARSSGAPARVAIEAAVERAGFDEAREVAAAWGSGRGGTVQRLWLSWAGAAVIWWIVLFVATSMLVLIARMSLTAFGHGQALREATRAAQGLCPACGYDLRGLEFSERCPECGTLQD